MSLCGNCPIPFHEGMDSKCPYYCSYQDAVYKTQIAYQELYEKLKNNNKYYNTDDTANDYCE